MKNPKFNPTDTNYERIFWNSLRKQTVLITEHSHAKAPMTNAYVLPTVQAGEYLEELEKENFFRRLGTVLPMYYNDYTVSTIATDAEAQWVAEGDNIPEDEEVLNTYRFDTHRLSSIAKIHINLLEDEGFDFEEWILKKFSHRFAHAEAKAFLVGTGKGEPLGILADQGGAEVGVTTNSASITFDEVMALFHSLDPRFRENAVWVMNDATALALRTLKDNDGNYLWGPSAEKLLGKTVIICNQVPDIASGNKPIAFGDFSYYWIMERVPFAIRPLTEKYHMAQYRGYVGYEHLDGKLIRPEAIKVLKIAA